MQQNGPWTVQQSKRIYQNPHLTVQEDQVLRPDGQPGTYATVTLLPGVAVLPLDSDQCVYLVKQFRYALGQESIEVIAGSYQADEEPQDGARRELEEEVGIQAKKWTPLGFLNIETSIVRAPVHLFLAQGIVMTRPKREGTETIQTVKYVLDEAVQMVLDGMITHAPSALLILKAYHLLKASAGSAQESY